MQASFPASASTSLIQGYCDDFVALAASMAQTLEQVTMRNLELGDSRTSLARVERGMRDLADAIGDVLARTKDEAPPAKGAAPAPARTPVRTPAPAQRPKLPQRPPAPRRADAQKRADRSDPAARPGPRAMPVAPAGALPPADDHVRRPNEGVHHEARAAAAETSRPPTVDATRMPTRPTATSMLAGTNETMPLRSVFQFLSRMRKSGTLRVTIDEEDLTFDFADGCIVATTSNRMQQEERLGDLLVELNFVAPMDLQVFVKLHGHSLSQLGGALVQAGRITEGQLAEALELQVSRRFKRAVAASKATYDFRECPRPGGDGRIRIRAFEILSGANPGNDMPL